MGRGQFTSTQMILVDGKYLMERKWLEKYSKNKTLKLLLLLGG